MNLKINRNKLPAKYALEVYKMVDGYPSTIDILYELVTVLEERGTLEESFVGRSVMKEVVTREAGLDLEDSLVKLSKEGWLSRDGEHYKLIKHPWSETKNII